MVKNEKKYTTVIYERPRNATFLLLSTERPWLCIQCPRAFKSFSHLREHVEGIHVRIKHQCNLCPKYFYLERQLKCHMKKHKHTTNSEETQAEITSIDQSNPTNFLKSEDWSFPFSTYVLSKLHNTKFEIRIMVILERNIA